MTQFTNAKIFFCSRPNATGLEHNLKSLLFIFAGAKLSLSCKLYILKKKHFDKYKCTNYIQFLRPKLKLLVKKILRFFFYLHDVNVLIMVQIGGHKEDKSMCTFKIFFKQAYRGFSFILA